MAEQWTGKGSRHRTPDLEKYGSNFDRVFPNRFIPRWDKEALAAREVYRAELTAQEAQSKTDVQAES
jgi:hypothetical protein